MNTQPLTGLFRGRKALDGYVEPAPKRDHQPTILLELVDWYPAVIDGEYAQECDFHALIIDPSNYIHLRPNTSDYDKAMIAREFPRAIHFGNIDRSRGRIREGSTVRNLRLSYPEAFAALDKWTRVADARAWQ